MQEQRENVLIEHLKKIIRTNHYPTGDSYSHRHRPAPPVTAEELAQAERRLGFALPSVLRRVYLEVGDGGFGPGYGLFPLDTHQLSTDSLVTAYLGMRSLSQQDIDEHWADDEVKPSLWPERVLMLCDWGCNIYSCLNCADPGVPILRMDSNENFLVEWAIEAPSLQSWLEAWLEGKPLFALDWQQATKVAVASLRQA